jgi:hypothetical protein
MRSFVLGTIIRPLMLILWMLVFWGTFVLLTWMWSLGSRGVDATWDLIRPRSGAALPELANFVLPFYAALIWAFIGMLSLRARRLRRERPTEEEA